MCITRYKVAKKHLIFKPGDIINVTQEKPYHNDFVLTFDKYIGYKIQKYNKKINKKSIIGKVKSYQRDI